MDKSMADGLKEASDLDNQVFGAHPSTLFDHEKSGRYKKKKKGL
jgi:hypothetical protein